LDHFRNRLAASHGSFADVWDTIKPEIVPIVQPPQKKLIHKTLQIIETGERGSTEEVGVKNLWNFNLPDGSLILEIKEGQIASEQRSEGNSTSHLTPTDFEGFKFDYRRSERRVKATSSQLVEQTVSATEIYRQSDVITDPWTSNSTDSAALGPHNNLGAYAYNFTTAGQSQMDYSMPSSTAGVDSISAFLIGN
jgi:Protein of unknown function (DUF2433)